MIVNPIMFENKYKCKKQVMEYLVFECHLPLLSIDEDFFYFTDNERLRECLKSMPFGLKLLALFVR